MAVEVVHLPNDLIVNILSRLSSNCLLRFKFVCKSWYSLITQYTVLRNLHIRNSNSNNTGDSLRLANPRHQGKQYYSLYGSNLWNYDRRFPCSTNIQPYHVPVVVYLPNDLIVNILSRLPSKCLLRFKSVCKSWYSLITHDTFFQTLHLRNSNLNNIGDSLWLANPPNEENKYYCLYGSNLWVYDRRFRCSTKSRPYDHIPVEHKLPSSSVWSSCIVGWCDGVVAIKQYLFPLRTLIICLWNPSIGKHKKVCLPWNKITTESRFNAPPTITNECSLISFYGLGLDVQCKEYKFVVVCPDNAKEVSYVFVYSLKTGKWTKIEREFIPISFKSYFRGGKCYGTYVNGACHWIHNDLRCGKDAVLSFNLSGHSFRYIDLPPKSPPCGYGNDYDNLFKMSVWKDMLSVSETTKTGTSWALNIWVIKDYSNSSSCCWTLIKKVNIMENYWDKNESCPWGIMNKNSKWGISNKYLSSSTPFIDSMSVDEKEEIQKYIAASLCGLVPFQESLVLP